MPHPTRQAPRQIVAEPTENPPSLPPAMRALAVLIVLDGLLGIWLTLNAREALPAYLAPQIPVVGIGGVLWGFLPDELKKNFGAWLERQLARRTLFWIVVSGSAVAIIASLFVGTVTVQSGAVDAPVKISFVNGSRADSTHTWSNLPRQDPLRLNALHTHAQWRLPVVPSGRRIWLVTEHEISATDVRVRPWLGEVLDYPDDFRPLVTIAVLPKDSVFESHAVDNDVVFRIRSGGAGSSLIAEGKIGRAGSLVSFAPPDEIDPDVLARWRARLAAQPSVAISADQMLAKWNQGATHPVTARVPIWQGELISWEYADAQGHVIAHDTLTLKNRITDLYLGW